MEDRPERQNQILSTRRKMSGSNLLVPEEKEVLMPLLLGARWKALKCFTSIQRWNENMCEMTFSSLVLWTCLPVREFSISPLTDEQGAERHLNNPA